MSSGDMTDRRGFLTKVGTVAGTVAIAGCTSGDGSTEETTAPPDTTEAPDDDGTEEPTETTASGQPQGRLVYSRANHVSSLDFMTAEAVSNDNIKVLMNVYDPVLRFEPGNTVLRSALATEWEVSDTTVNLTLRQGVTFHNGEEFTADDLVATFRRYTDPDYEYFIEESTEGTQNGYAGFTYGKVTNVSKNGDYEVTMELTEPFAPVLRNLAMWSASVIPKSVIESEQDLTKDAIGTGPFALDEVDDGNQRVFLTAKEGGWYHEGPFVGEVVFNAISENSTRVQSLINGESHLVDGLTPTTAAQVRNANGVELRRKVGGNVGSLAMNLAAREEFRDERVRKALKLAIDTQSVIEELYQGFARIGTQPSPPIMLGFNEDLEPHSHDPDQAQSLLEEAGYGDGFEIEVSTFQNPRTYHPAPLQTAEVVRTNLGEIGIDVTINQMPFGDWFSYALEGNHELIQTGWVTDNADPDNILFTLLDPGLPMEDFPSDRNWVDRSHPDYNRFNFTGWYDQEFVQNVRDGRTTYDTDERRGFYEEANRIAHERGAWVTYGYQELLRGVSNDVSDYNVAVKVNENLQTIKLG